MAPSESQARHRRGEIRGKAQDAASSTRAVLILIGGIIAAGALYIGGVLPFLASGILASVGVVVVALGGGLASLAAYFRKSSDEPAERAVWLVVTALVVTAAIFFVGGI